MEINLDSTRAEIVPTLQAISSSGRVENAGAGSRLAVARAGAGTVLVARDAFRYSASVLGPPLERRLPMESRREVYREVFALYKSLRVGPRGARKSP